MATSLDQFEQDINEAMLRDRFRLRRLLREWRQGRKSRERTEERFLQLLEQSRTLLAERRQALPRPEFELDLPVIARREELAKAIADNQVVIVCGETGSGKSTQLPKICLDMGRGAEGLIGHTQPRRIAARSIASRLADELQTTVGQGVGFKIRFTDSTSPKTFVKLMTDGILLAETQGDRFLEQYDTIILDEAHERSLNIDFLLGYLKRLLPKRPDLRLIITSATIDVERFSQHFGDEQPAPVIEVAGRTYPVDVRYFEMSDDEEPDGTTDVHRAVADAAEEAARIDRGDMLVFLPTERDIRESARVLRGRRFAGDKDASSTEILPLYSRLSNEQQNRIFQSHKQRRIVLATNVAESSLTVPNIRFVIDTGTARISRYSPRSKVQRLPIEAISQAAADQRKGRCGRVGPGVCFRLYSEDDYLQRDRYTTPEIQRTNLAAVILQTLALKLGAIEQFPFLDPPRPEKVRDGFKTLYELGAIDERQQLTEIGKQLSRLPVDPRIGRMILAAGEENCLHEILIIAAALEVQDPRERPVDKQAAADEQHAKFADGQSDFLSYLKLWDFFHDLREKLSHSQLRKACKRNFLSFNRIREWLDVQRQLKQLASQIGLRVRKRHDQSEAIHRALLRGLLSNVAFRGDGNEYTAVGGKFYLWPGSGVFEGKPKWVVAGELVETSRRYLRTVGRINPNWIEELAPHLIKRSYSDPHWRGKAGSAMAFEKVTLFGLTVTPKRRVPLGPIDPEEARRILISDGLAEGDFHQRMDFYTHNQALLAEVASLRDKTRRRDYVVDPWTIQRFYNDRIPEDVTDTDRLRKWLRRRKGDAKRVLHMRRDDLLADSNEVDQQQFPDSLSLESMQLDVRYRFEPGEETDGVTIRVPKEGLGRINDRRLGWLVPGLLEEKVLALIRSLPKSLRRNFVPAPEVAKRVAVELPFGEGDFLPQLAAALSRISEETIRPGDFDESRLPQHLRIQVEVVDQHGDSLAAGRDVEELRERLGVEAAEPVIEVDDQQWKRDGITKWDFGQLPETVRLSRGGIEVPFYPALVDHGESIGLRLFDSPEQSAAMTRAGLRRLFYLAARKSLRSQVEWLPAWKEIQVYGASLPDAKRLRQQLGELIADRAFFSQPFTPQDEESFDAQCKYARAEIGIATQDVSSIVGPLFKSYHEARLAIENATSSQWVDVVADVRYQLRDLTAEGFLTSTPWDWLQHYPRYLQAIRVRFEKLRNAGLKRDQKNQGELTPHLQLLDEYLAEQPNALIANGELVTFRWMLEEFRVSLFAQELGVSQSVSSRRLEKQWDKAMRR